MKILTNKNILIISPESWGKSYLSKHFYALELLKHNNRVWFLNSFYYKKDDFARQTEASYPGLTIVDDVTVSGLHKMPTFIQRLIIRRQIARLQKKCQTSWDVVWSFDNSRYFFLDCFGNDAIRIHHVMDEHMNYDLKNACRTANLCLGVTPGIVNACSSFNPNSYFLQHGFAAFKCENVFLEKGSQKFHLVYIGNLLLPSFDRKLLLELAHRFKNIRFHLIGSYTLGNLNSRPASDSDFIQQFQELENVKLYGEKEYSEAISMAAQGDILALLYFDQDGIIAENSSKILPYLSTGKVVISNYFAMYEGLNLMRMVKHRNEYGDMLQGVLERPDELNDAKSAGERMEFAQEHTYSKQLEKIDGLLSSLRT